MFPILPGRCSLTGNVREDGLLGVGDFMSPAFRKGLREAGRPGRGDRRGVEGEVAGVMWDGGWARKGWGRHGDGPEMPG